MNFFISLLIALKKIFWYRQKWAAVTNSTFFERFEPVPMFGT